MTEDEPRIIINGELLTIAQAMTVRVALTSFDIKLDAQGLGDDDRGRAMVEAYQARLTELNAIIFKQRSAAPT